MRTKGLKNQPTCKCGCGAFVKYHKGEWRKWIIGHHTRSDEMRKMHSDRMRGNSLFLGGKMPTEAKIKIAKSQTGSNNSNWNNGRTLAGGGYIMILCPNHPFKDVNGRVREERLVVEKHLGRYLTKEESVHHINKIKTDNRLENLQVMTRSEHFSFHALEKWDLGMIRNGRKNDKKN